MSLAAKSLCTNRSVTANFRTGMTTPTCQPGHRVQCAPGVCDLVVLLKGAVTRAVACMRFARSLHTLLVAGPNETARYSNLAQVKKVIQTSEISRITYETTLGR